MFPRGLAPLRTVQMRQRRPQSSFIKRVMDQVKDDLERNEGYRKARADLEKSGTRDKLRQQAVAQEENFRRWKESVASKTASTKSMFMRMKQQAQEETGKVQTKIHETIGGSSSSTSEPNVYFVRARESTRRYLEHAKTASSAVGSGVGRMLDATRAATAILETKEGQTRHEAWVIQRDRNRDEREEARRKSEKETASVDSVKEERREEEPTRPEPPNTSASALVVRHETAWDRFGTRLGDMPFLSSMYDNPLFDRVFGETELARSVREMKDIDPEFTLADFADEIENVVAPQVVKCFLDGDRDTLFRHCAGPAFAAVDSSMKERARQKCYLDSDILMGPSEVELKGAKAMDNAAPSFIWTFQTQQVNCLRDHEHNVIEGAVDDIRTVFYAMAITRHPILDENPDEAMALDYRWQIRELAIVGNQHSW